MPELKNQRHELFAQGLAGGKSADEAYEAAGYKQNRHNASRLKTKEHITIRVAEIQGKAAERVEIDRAWVLERLVENVERSMQAAAVKNAEGEAIGEYAYQGNVANKALELLGKEIGMFVDRKEVRTGKLDAIEDDQLDDLIAGVKSILASGAVGEAPGREETPQVGKPH